MKMKKCDACGGTGKVNDHPATAEDMRRLREKSGDSLRSVARAMNISPMALSRLELGQTPWSDRLIASFKASLDHV